MRKNSSTNPYRLAEFAFRSARARYFLRAPAPVVSRPELFSYIWYISSARMFSNGSRGRTSFAPSTHGQFDRIPAELLMSIRKAGLELKRCVVIQHCFWGRVYKRCNFVMRHSAIDCELV